MVIPLTSAGHAPPVDQRDPSRLDHASREFLDVFQRDKRIVEQRDRDRDEQRRRREDVGNPETKERRRPADENTSQPPSQAVQGEVSRRLAARNAQPQPGSVRELARPDPRDGRAAEQRPRQPGSETGLQAQPRIPAQGQAQAQAQAQALAQARQQPPPLVARGPMAPQSPTTAPMFSQPLFATMPLQADASARDTADRPIPLLGPNAGQMQRARGGAIAGSPARPALGPGSGPAARPMPQASAGSIAAIGAATPFVQPGLTLNRATPPEVIERVNAFLSGAPLDQKPFHLQPMDAVVFEKPRSPQGDALAAAQIGPRSGALRGAPISPLARLLARPSAPGPTPANDALAPTASPPVAKRPSAAGILAANDAPTPLGQLLFREAVPRRTGQPVGDTTRPYPFTPVR